MVIIFVRADPDPLDRIPDDLADGSVVIAYPNKVDDGKGIFKIRFFSERLSDGVRLNFNNYKIIRGFSSAAVSYFMTTPIIMKTNLLLTLAAAFAFAVLPAIAQSGNDAKPAPAASSAVQKYTCPMHPEVISDKPGKCPKCGMNLVLVKASPTPKK